jgi:hypothetical protein
MLRNRLSDLQLNHAESDSSTKHPKIIRSSPPRPVEIIVQTRKSGPSRQPEDQQQEFQNDDRDPVVDFGGGVDTDEVVCQDESAEEGLYDVSVAMNQNARGVVGWD